MIAQGTHAGPPALTLAEWEICKRGEHELRARTTEYRAFGDPNRRQTTPLRKYLVLQ